MDGLVDTLIAQRNAVAAIVQRSSGPALRRILLRIRKDLDRRIALLAPEDASWNATQVTAARALVQDALQETRLQVRGLVGSTSDILMRRGASDTLAVLRAMEKRFAGAVRPLALDQIIGFDVITQGVRASLLRRHETSIERYGRRVIGQVERTMQAGLARPYRSIDVSWRRAGFDEMRREVGAVIGRTDYWAERIVRTELLYSYNVSTQLALEETQKVDFPDLRRVIVAHFDSRTAHDSVFVHGQVRGLHEDFVDGAGRVYNVPPARPNDRETLIPWREAWGALPEPLQPRPAPERRAAAIAAGGGREAIAAGKPKPARKTA